MEGVEYALGRDRLGISTLFVALALAHILPTNPTDITLLVYSQRERVKSYRSMPIGREARSLGAIRMPARWNARTWLLCGADKPC
jgi:hypothetical protein